MCNLIDCTQLVWEEGVIIVPILAMMTLRLRELMGVARNRLIRKELKFEPGLPDSQAGPLSRAYPRSCDSIPRKQETSAVALWCPARQRQASASEAPGVGPMDAPLAEVLGKADSRGQDP